MKRQQSRVMVLSWWLLSPPQDVTHTRLCILTFWTANSTLHLRTE